MIPYQCPRHALALRYNDTADKLECPHSCSFPVINGIPRFVSADNYTSSLVLYWNGVIRNTKLDSYTKTSINRDKLLSILGGLDWLKGKTVLQAGCGAGRFSEVLLEAGALLHSLDLSSGAEATQANCVYFPNHNVCQSNILDMPYPPESFDAVICIGVIHHTPNPEESIAALARMVEPGGLLFIDHYTPDYSMPLVSRVLRSFLPGKNPEYRIRFCSRLRKLLWPLHTKLHARQRKQLCGKLYRLLCNFSPLADYQNAYPQLSPEILREWAALDMHDLLTKVYKHSRTTEQIGKALAGNGLEITRYVYAGNSVEAAARKPFPNMDTGETNHDIAILRKKIP
jgi:2-polyprenyl-3-methyl-5-hydroxy-6-metoxy-1,4-benzoquinol methylase